MEKRTKPSRRLVDLSEFHYLKLETIRGKCRKAGRTVPSIPLLVGRALDRCVDDLATEFAAK